MTSARVAVGTATPADLERAARATHNWSVVLQQSVEQRLSPLLHKQLLEVSASVCPPEDRERLQALYHASVQRGLFVSTQLLRLLDVLASAGVPALPFKGPVLAIHAYGDAGLRAPVDLDLLVPRKHIWAATRILLDAGFSRNGAWPPHHDAWLLAQGGELAFDSPDGDLMVEVHERVGSLLDVTSIPAEHLLARATSVDLLGQQVLAPSLDDSLLVLCVHGARHEWDKLEQVLAAGCIMRAMTSEQWQGFLEEARRWSCMRRALVGVRMANVVLGVRLPQSVEVELRRDVRAERLACAALVRLHKGRQTGVRADLRSAAWAALCEDSTTSGAEHVLRRLFTPGPEDWVALGLLPALTPAYWALRPIRLAGKYARRAVGGFPRERVSTRGR